jgi:hypothetical protein
VWIVLCMLLHGKITYGKARSVLGILFASPWHSNGKKLLRRKGQGFLAVLGINIERFAST